jgi:hypothetical protein
MVVTLEPVEVDSLVWVHKVVLVELDMFALFVTTNTKVVLVPDVVQKCNVQIFR